MPHIYLSIPNSDKLFNPHSHFFGWVHPTEVDISPGDDAQGEKKK